MSTHKNIDRICVAAIVTAIIISAVLIFFVGSQAKSDAKAVSMPYEDLIFDTSCVHTIDIVMDDFDGFISTCENEEYTACSVIIDGEAYKNVGLRAKGNTSLSKVSSMDSSRYSFKIEFDHYDSSLSYHGLDKLSLNNLIQDNTMMKDYLTYRMMNEFGAASPLVSFVYITVNGEDWGLYLAAEGVEDAFLKRNYGSDHGELYKPDSMEMGGGRGNGKDFDIGEFGFTDTEDSENTAPHGFEKERDSGGGRENLNTARPEGAAPSGIGDSGQQRNDRNASTEKEPPSHQMPQGGGMGNSSGALLQYTDDDPESYALIFDSAKTDITDSDKQRLIASLKTLNGFKDIESAVDLDALIRYFVVHNFVVNGDSYTGGMIHNYYLYEEDGKLSMIPWDYNLAFGSFQSSSATDSVNDPIDTPLSVTGDGSRPMIDCILSDQKYTEMYHEYFAEFLNTVDIEGIVSEAHNLIAPYVKKDPTKFCTYEEYEAAVSTLTEFISLRTQSVKGQLEGSIPSTDEGQKKDASSLIDASHISISDMGTMGMGGDKEPGGFPDINDSAGFNTPPEGAMPDSFNISEGQDNSGQAEKNSTSSENAIPDKGIPDSFGGGDKRQMSAAAGNNDSLLTLLIICAAAAAAAAAVLIIYRRK